MAVGHTKLRTYGHAKPYRYAHANLPKSKKKINRKIQTLPAAPLGPCRRESHLTA